MKLLAIAMLAAIFLVGCASNQGAQRRRPVDYETVWECQKILVSSGRLPNACGGI